MKTHTTISFYRYVTLEHPEVLQNTLQEYCQEQGILGRILIAIEGINGAVSGRTKIIKKFKTVLQQHFPALTFREQQAEHNTYHKLVVRLRKEIVALGITADMTKKGLHVPPKELKKMLDSKEDIILLDARNKYETRIGKFKNSIELSIQHFSQFPEAIKKLKHLKNKKIIMYCTGGVRCEKSSAYLKEEGFKNVNQLEGGIINYNTQFPNTHYEGGCFVFDDRLNDRVGKQPLSSCERCKMPNDDIENCHNLDCDKLYINCKECKKEMNHCCSKDCKTSLRQRPPQKTPKLRVGKVTNYYVKNSIAEIVLEKELPEHEPLFFKGKTTTFSQPPASIIVHEEKLITIPVTKRVRKNDEVLIEC